MQLFSADPTIFKNIKNALKSSIVMAVWIFFSAAQTAQNSPELKVNIRNVAQDTSVYYSVVWTLSKIKTWLVMQKVYLIK